MAVTQYIGSRYVPLFAEPIEWSSQSTYEPLTIVLHEGNSYTSRQAVPKDIAIDNEDFWALTGNYNAQVELYRRETSAAKATADEAQETAEGAQTAADAAQTDIDTLLPKSAFSASNTVNDAINAEHAYANSAFAHSFGNVAAMQAFMEFSSGDVAHTSGFYTPNDGGSASYRVDSVGPANGMDILALQDGLFAHLIVNDKANACAMGCKKDGSADVSEIVNAMTEKYELYFPCGKYRVDFPIYFKRSAYGSGWDRLWDGTNTQFVSNMDSEDSSVGVINVTNTFIGVTGIELACFNVKCDGLEKGIDVRTQTNPINVTVHDISIFDCNSIGFYLNPNSGDSRNVLVFNCSAWHKRGVPETFQNSKGFAIGGNAYDSMITNCYAMAFERGFEILPYATVANLHSWCSMNGLTQTQWERSIAFYFNTSGLATNLYADTAYVLVQKNAGGAISIKNLYAYYDSTISSFSPTITPFKATNNGELHIDGCIIEDQHGFVVNMGDSDSSQNWSVFVNNLMLYTNADIGSNAKLIPTNFNWNYRLTNIDTSKWTEIATIYKNVSASASFASFHVQNQNGYYAEVSCDVIGSNINVYLDAISANYLHVKYLVDGNAIRFFVDGSPVISVDPITYNAQLKLMNYGSIKNFTNRTPKSRQVLDSDSTLSVPTTRIRQ